MLLNSVDSKNLNIYDLFPSPPWVIKALIENANITPGCYCLEPSAGFGNLADKIQNKGGIVEVIEIIPQLQVLLTLKDLLVIGSNFLTTPNLEEKYDRVLQNPPFRIQYSHIKKAYECLKQTGRLVSLMSSSPWRYNRSRDKQFKRWLKSVNAEIIELPWGQFVNSNRYTDVECYIVIIDK